MDELHNIDYIGGFLMISYLYINTNVSNTNNASASNAIPKHIISLLLIQIFTTIIKSVYLKQAITIHNFPKDFHKAMIIFCAFIIFHAVINKELVQIK